MDTLEDIIKQVITDIREKKKKKPDSNLILREAEVKHGLNYTIAKDVLDQMVQDNKIIVNSENSHFINNKSYSSSQSEVNEIHGSSDSGAILQNSPPITNASSGTGYEVVNEPASQEGGSFSTSYPSNALTAQITSFGKMADSLIELNRLLQEERSKNLILMEENYSLKLKLRADGVNNLVLQTAIVPDGIPNNSAFVSDEIPNNSAIVQPLCVNDQSPSNKNTQQLKSMKNKQKKRKGKQANKTVAQQIKDVGNCNTGQNAATQVSKSASSAPSGPASQTTAATGATGNKETNPANDSSENGSQDPGVWRKNTVLVVGDSMVSNINEKTLSRKFHMKVRSFPGANTRDLQDYVKPLIRKRPEKIIIVIGTNDIERKPVTEILRSIKLVMDMILEKITRLPPCHLRDNSTCRQQAERC